MSANELRSLMAAQILSGLLKRGPKETAVFPQTDEMAVERAVKLAKAIQDEVAKSLGMLPS